MIQPNRVGKIDVQAAWEAGQRVRRTHEMLVPFLRAGRTLAEIDAEVARILDELDSKSCFIRYRAGGSMPPYPNHACLSVNDCVVHGTSASHTAPLKRGDVLKVDIGLTHKGWIGDAAWTYAIGEASPLALRLIACGRESLAMGIKELKPGNTLLSWARTVQTIVEQKHGFHCVRRLGGHGYGRKLHAKPWVSNVVPSFPGEWPEALSMCEPGMLLAVEPMIGAGTGEIKDHDRQWPIFIADGSLAVHYEADVLVTEEGPRDLTEGMQGLPDIVG